MKKKLRFYLFVAAFASILVFNHCTEDDGLTVCAGCTSDAPWSVPGSTNCYQSFDDCDASERGDCTICD